MSHQLMQLPQNGSGYYSYSLSNRQFGDSSVIALLTGFAARWSQSHPNHPIGIGDISFKAGGPMKPHGSHQRGLDVDIRPMRADGRHLRTSIGDKSYNRKITNELVQSLRKLPELRTILFNDHNVLGVKSFPGHHNHLHLSFRSRTGA